MVAWKPNLTNLLSIFTTLARLHRNHIISFSNFIDSRRMKSKLYKPIDMMIEK